jgi:hypothetical protein
MDVNPKYSFTHVHKSQKVYYAGYENNFLVLPDGKTIVGVEYKGNVNVLFMEDITRNDITAYRQIATHGNWIYCVLYNPVSKTLFVGDENGRVVQYQEGGNKETWSKVKDYGDLGIGYICSVDQIGDVVVFGGYQSYFIRAINSVSKTLLRGSLKTAIEYVDSLRFCEVPENKVYLSVCGRIPSYSNNKTDIYDATKLAKAFGYHFQEKLNIPLSTSSEGSVVEEPIETSPSCGCNTQRVIDNLLTRITDCFQVFRRVISSDFESRLKSILSNYVGVSIINRFI